MQIQGFLADSTVLSNTPAARQSGDESRRELVKLYLVGSLSGIMAITRTLHYRGFAEVNDWSKPQPTGTPGEYVSVLIRQVQLS